MNLQFLTELAQRGVKLWAENGQLRYRAPKGVLTPELRDELALHKEELIKLLHNSNANHCEVDLPLVRVERERNLPLSFAQARLWFLSQLEPNNPFYNELQALRLDGSLNLVALERSLNKIIAQHEALRTNFVKVDGQPTQVIADSLTLSIRVIDLADISEGEKEISVQRLAIAEAQQPFDLDSSPLVRACVFKLTEVEHVLLLTIHHIVWDGWSWGILLRELATLYSAFCNDLSPELPELSIQYADFAVWQRQWLQGEVLSSQLDYWKQQLEDAPALLELPTDRVRPSIQTYRGAHQPFALSKELTRALVSLSQCQGVTLFMTLLAAFQTFLHRYTGQTDICVGTPHANRSRPEVEGVIGFFANTLVLRTCLAENPSFEEVLSRVRDLTLEAYAHQDLPFEKLVEQLQPERSLSYTPLVQVMLVLNEPMLQLQMTGLTVSPLAVETTTAKFDLTLSLENTDFGLIGNWEYNTDLFDASTIARMAQHFQTLLEGVVAHPQQWVSQLPLLTEQERHQLLVEWNNTTKEYPSDKCIHQLFEEQVERTPDAVAVLFEEEQLTYRELNAKANQLAHYLKLLGVEPEVLVGICLERSIEMIVGILGILKAGGAYVPLDPAYPSERLAFMLEDSSLPVLLTQAHLVEKLPQHLARVVCLDSDWSEIAYLSNENPTSEIVPDNLAYVIYTSGSTGEPKGVLIEHQAIASHCQNVTTHYQLILSDRALQFASIGFDVSLEQIIPTLIVGARLTLFETKSLDVPEFHQKLLQSGLTVINLPPVYLTPWLQFLEENPLATSLEDLRLVICGGETMPLEILKLWQKSPLKTIRLLNAYGPTETTITTTTFEVPPRISLSRVPIGRPLKNRKVYILSPQQQLAPIGVPGELYIGGDGLARGYLNRPDLTTERFIPNPFSNEVSSRLYKTGDLARYLPDGNIEFLGRIDHQVKIRGFRIELGEIESVLSQYSNMQQAVVIVREEVPRDKQLVAYCVTQPEIDSMQELRTFLKRQLPEYMVPTDFVLMEALPLTPNGKVDRQALPAPDRTRSQLEHFVAPTTPTEVSLARIWTQILGLQQAGVNDNFFELGGHSLLATQIISRIRSAFSIELSLRSLFEAPTIASLAEVIETTQKEKLQGQSADSTKFGTLPPLVPIARDTPIPLSFSQQMVWNLQQLHIDSCAYNCPITLCFNDFLRKEELEKSINEIIRRHQILRTTFTVVTEQPLQVIAPSLILPLSVIDLQHLPQEKREVEAVKLANQEALHHFDLAAGPLIKTTLICLAPQKHWLLITMHHIITDGWSYGIFLQELGTLYEAFSNGLPSPLPEVKIQYADFTLWQQKYLNEEILEKQRSYWLKKLTNIPPKLDLLPNFQPKFKSGSKRTGSYSIILPYDRVALIEALSRSQGVTTFAIILAALKILLYKLSGQTDIIILATTANRSTPEVEKMLGCFINDVFLYDKIDDFQTGLTFLERVNQTIGEALANQDISEKSIKTISELEFIRTINVSMAPPIHWNSKILECEVASINLEHELWDEQSLPLELYIYSQDVDSTTIEIVGYYSKKFFAEENIERLFNDCQEILKQLVQYPETVLSEF